MEMGVGGRKLGVCVGGRKLGVLVRGGGKLGRWVKTRGYVIEIASPDRERDM